MAKQGQRVVKPNQLADLRSPLGGFLFANRLNCKRTIYQKWYTIR